MITIDLITGFLGSGKTTFLRRYVKYLLGRGEKVCILENDYGAVNVDMMLLADLIGERCDMEMVAGGSDSDTHRRRFKTKLIEMGMIGYTHVIVEPSGIFDTDEFYDSLHEEPLESWYRVGCQVTIVDAGLILPLSDTSRYVFASEAANAGTILFSKTQLNPPDSYLKILKYLNEALTSISCRRQIGEDSLVAKDWDHLSDEDLDRIEHSGYADFSYEKQDVVDEHRYESLYFMEKGFTPALVEEKARAAFADPDCGGIIRIKGFCRDGDGWAQVNVTRKDEDVSPIARGQEVVIVIGEHLGKEALSRLFGEPAEIHAD